MDLKIMAEIEQELKRFNIRIQAVKARYKKDSWAEMNCKENGALKRAALDLKQELNKITR